MVIKAFILINVIIVSMGKLKPNLSVSHNGYSIINTVHTGFLLENINVLGKLDNFKTF